MHQHNSLSRHPHSFCLLTLLFILPGLSACVTPPSSEEITDNTPQTTDTFWFLDTEETEDVDNTPQAVTQTADTSQSDNIVTTEPTDDQPSTPETALIEPEPVTPESVQIEPEPTRSEPEPAIQAPVVASLAESETVSSDASCKNLPYSLYEKQARASIAKGLSATTANIYGVGFRNLDEHKKWNDTHNALFTAVNQACLTLSKCAKQHPKDKTTQCANQAKQFDEWQNLAARFTEKAKQSETTQPPKICSFTADPADAASCFHALADNVDNACTSSECKKTSDCWRGIGFLDGAINQAASACRFVRTPLAECRGYVTATQRRKNKFERCANMQKNLNVRIIPVL